MSPGPEGQSRKKGPFNDLSGLAHVAEVLESRTAQLNAIESQDQEPPEIEFVSELGPPDPGLGSLVQRIERDKDEKSE